MNFVSIALVLITMLAGIIYPKTSGETEHYPLINGTLCESPDGTSRTATITVKSFSDNIDGENDDVIVAFSYLESEDGEWAAEEIVKHGKFTSLSKSFEFTTAVPVAFDIIFTSWSDIEWGDGKLSNRKSSTGLQWVGRCVNDAQDTPTATPTSTSTATATSTATSTVTPRIVLTTVTSTATTTSTIVMTPTATPTNTPTITITPSPPPTEVGEISTPVCIVGDSACPLKDEESPEPRQTSIYLPIVAKG